MPSWRLGVLGCAVGVFLSAYGAQLVSGGTGLPVALAEHSPPAGKRRRPLLIVTCCPHCGYGHVHYGTEPGGIRRAGCGGRRWYVVRVVSAARGVAA